MNKYGLTYWRPSALGRLVTSSPKWNLSIHDGKYELWIEAAHFTGAVHELDELQVAPGMFWSAVTFPLGRSGTHILDGVQNRQAKALRSAITLATRQKKIVDLIASLADGSHSICKWASGFRNQIANQFKFRGWLTKEFQETQVTARPEISETLFEAAEVQRFIAQSERVKRDIQLWRTAPKELMDALNVQHSEQALKNSKSFFDTVEKSPLTEEQARAVICFDNRVLLLASAGSGKTSTMVAKAGYALMQEYFPADKILLLAFNRDAADELGERIKARLTPLGLTAQDITAKTFHAFGLEIIGSATGKKPSIAPWVESGRDAEFLLELVDELKDNDPFFRMNWDMFRIVLGQDLPAFGKEGDSPDSWDKAKDINGFWTLNNDIVRSRGELLIANWLFYNGIEYEYEKQYEIETADAQYRQYRPDFYLPAAGVYLEHWALDAQGNPPVEFKDYKEGMAWKKALHAKHGTKLLETTTAGLWSGEAFRYLAEELPKLGLPLDPNPDRPVLGRKPIENRRLLGTVRSFLTHVKSNRLTMEELRIRLDTRVAGAFRFRHKMFLDLFERLWGAWEGKLRQGKFIDFDDMLGLAGDCIESGTWSSPYELVMVDEFQDTSHARNRLVQGLMRLPGKCLFVVGDDWQSINRFAGSDLEVMTGFDKSFEQPVTMKLETTFRCPQSLCDISSKFIQANPRQLNKRVVSASQNVEAPVKIFQVDSEDKLKLAVAARLAAIASAVPDGARPAKVFILGRYRKDSELVPDIFDASKVSVEFTTIHASKGLEADHVILPRVTAEGLGFPSRIEDDPVLQLAMPGGDTFPDAEERRLFYVALTRARKSVSVITLAHRESPFVIELIRQFKLDVHDVDGEPINRQLCKCGKGFLVRRTGKYGPFFGCSTFPTCRATQKIETRAR